MSSGFVNPIGPTGELMALVEADRFEALERFKRIALVVDWLRTGSEPVTVVVPCLFFL